MNRYAKIFAMLKRINKQEDAEYRAYLCNTVSDGRTTSLTDLSLFELNEVTKFLQSVTPDHKSFEEMSAERMRKKIFSKFRTLGWYINGKPDYPRIKNWMQKFGYLHKPLMEYKYNELPKLLTQIEFITNNEYDKKIKD